MPQLAERLAPWHDLHVGWKGWGMRGCEDNVLGKCACMCVENPWTTRGDEDTVKWCCSSSAGALAHKPLTLIGHFFDRPSWSMPSCDLREFANQQKARALQLQTHPCDTLLCQLQAECTTPPPATISPCRELEPRASHNARHAFSGKGIEARRTYNLVGNELVGENEEPIIAELPDGREARFACSGEPASPAQLTGSRPHTPHILAGSISMRPAR